MRCSRTAQHANTTKHVHCMLSVLAYLTLPYLTTPTRSVHNLLLLQYCYCYYSNAAKWSRNIRTLHFARRFSFFIRLDVCTSHYRTGQDRAHGGVWWRGGVLLCQLIRLLQIVLHGRHERQFVLHGSARWVHKRTDSWDTHYSILSYMNKKHYQYILSLVRNLLKISRHLLLALLAASWR